MAALSSDHLHASCVAIGGLAVLITGPSGSGKSDLALRMIDRGANLVSDDYTIIRRTANQLIASAPERLVGKIEVRGIGIVPMPCVASAPVGMIVTLTTQVERMPEARTQMFAGIDVPVFAINAFETSAPLKVELAVKGIQP